jgi:signal transduction histidine kinase
MKENQRLEAERNQQSRLESVGILADAVAVDFRTMLSGALDSLDASRKELEVLNTDGARLKLTEAQASLRRGNAINNQLLAFTRGGETRKGTINLELAIRKSVYQCLEGTKIAFILNLDHDLWRTSGDSEHLVHAFSNILGFVRRENPKEIKVRARNIMREVHGFEGAGKYIVTQIEDNGQGIPADRLEHIFDPFYGTRENNLSLDLPVAHSIIKKHGGLIDVETIAGGGNIFYIYLPAAV